MARKLLEWLVDPSSPVSGSGGGGPTLAQALQLPDKDVDELLNEDVAELGLEDNNLRALWDRAQTGLGQVDTTDALNASDDFECYTALMGASEGDEAPTVAGARACALERLALAAKHVHSRLAGVGQATSPGGGLVTAEGEILCEDLDAVVGREIAIPHKQASLSGLRHVKLAQARDAGKLVQVGLRRGWQNRKLQIAGALAEAGIADTAVDGRGAEEHAAGLALTYGSAAAQARLLYRVDDTLRNMWNAMVGKRPKEWGQLWEPGRGVHRDFLRAWVVRLMDPGSECSVDSPSERQIHFLTLGTVRVFVDALEHLYAARGFVFPVGLASELRALLSTSCGRAFPRVMGRADNITVHAALKAARAAERIGTEEPTDVVPAADDRPENAIGVADVADVGISVRQERTCFAVRLLRECRVELTEGDFDLRFTTKSGDDGGILGTFEQLVDNQLFGGDFALLDFRQEVGFEVVTEIADLQLRFLRRIDDEVFLGREVFHSGKGDGCGEAFEKFLRDRFRNHQLITEEALCSFHTTELVEYCLHTDVFDIHVVLGHGFLLWDASPSFPIC
jgi:hypothetical protein